jgi:hypothetical protein
LAIIGGCDEDDIDKCVAKSVFIGGLITKKSPILNFPTVQLYFFRVFFFVKSGVKLGKNFFQHQESKSYLYHVQLDTCTVISMYA